MKSIIIKITVLVASSLLILTKLVSSDQLIDLGSTLFFFAYISTVFSVSIITGSLMASVLHNKLLKKKYEEYELQLKQFEDTSLLEIKFSPSATKLYEDLVSLESKLKTLEKELQHESNN